MAKRSLISERPSYVSQMHFPP